VVGADFNVCQPFKAFHAWGVQYVLLSKQQKELNVLEKDV
jgi:hypothetical protein